MYTDLHKQKEAAKPVSLIDSVDTTGFSQFRVDYAPHSDDRGFRVNIWDGADLLGVVSCADMKPSAEHFPADFFAALNMSENSGLAIFGQNISIPIKYQKKGYGLNLFKLSLELCSKIVNGSWIVSICDDSVPTGWTTRQLPKLREYMESLGFQGENLWQGEVDNLNYYLIRWRKKDN